MRVVVLTGAGGKAFVSGADVSRFESERSSLDATRVYNQTVEKANASTRDQADHRDDPRLLHRRRAGARGLLRPAHLLRQLKQIPAAKLRYGYAGAKRLTDVVGPAFAKEIFYTARQFDAEEARVMGIVNRVVPEAELENYVKSLCRHDRHQRPADGENRQIYRQRGRERREQARPGALPELVEQCRQQRLYRGPQGLHGEAQTGVYRDVTEVSTGGGKLSRMPIQDWCFNRSSAESGGKTAAGGREDRAASVELRGLTKRYDDSRWWTTCRPPSSTGAWSACSGRRLRQDHHAAPDRRLRRAVGRARSASATSPGLAGAHRAARAATCR